MQNDLNGVSHLGKFLTYKHRHDIVISFINTKLQLFNKQSLTSGIQLERKVRQLELNLKKESDGRRKDKIVHDEEMKRLRSSVHLIR